MAILPRSLELARIAFFREMYGELDLGRQCNSEADGWENWWVKSGWKKDEKMAGEWNYTSGKWHGDPNDKVHAILTYKDTNHLIKKDVPCETDQLTHVYTFILLPNATYIILIDNVEKQTGSLFSDWDLLPPKKIKDPEAKKPEDWDEKEFIPDPEDKKPEGYDDIPKEIPDPDAKKKIKNPNYKGKWKAPMIDNPVHHFCRVKSGTLFDNVLICDDPEYAKKLAEETWGKHKDAAFDEAEKNIEDEVIDLFITAIAEIKITVPRAYVEACYKIVAGLGAGPSKHARGVVGGSDSDEDYVDSSSGED
ncbi:hypothetical protein LOK49_LG04G02804 [Camellia lanceoleosa]|uniref:Uncharacterized protein n=1 Tax=Camellia lanceoleosa TaxID=1840588 RepID=A0ACC0HYM9_9ERIC|nr:hypothetical protein LOK49_LG04G02804 [Camellia lanceoleosa]